MEAPARGPRSPATLVVFLAAAALACAGFVALGVWQVERLGCTFMALADRMEELREQLGLTEEDLNLNLGPLGTLL